MWLQASLLALGHMGRNEIMHCIICIELHHLHCIASFVLHLKVYLYFYEAVDVSIIMRFNFDT